VPFAGEVTGNASFRLTHKGKVGGHTVTVVTTVAGVIG